MPRNNGRSAWIIEMYVDKKWVRSIDYPIGYVSQLRAQEQIQVIHMTQGKNVTYRAARYSAQTK